MRRSEHVERLEFVNLRLGVDMQAYTDEIVPRFVPSVRSLRVEFEKEEKPLGLSEMKHLLFDLSLVLPNVERLCIGYAGIGSYGR